MKKLSITLIIIYLLSISPLSAQQRIVVRNVKKIVLNTGNFSLGPSTNIEAELIKENGKWNSYLTKKDVFRLGGKQDSISRQKLIASIQEKQIVVFLNNILIVKPKLDTRIFNLTPAVLLGNLKKEAKDPHQDPSELEKVITSTAIQRVLSANFKDENVLDYESSCSITIITYDDRKVKLATAHLYPTKLPWTVNGRDSYNFDINKFFLAAMGDEDYPNRDALDLNSLKESIYNNIDENHTTRPIGTYRFKYDVPNNFNVIKKNFKYKGSITSDHTYYGILQNELMTDNTRIWATFDIRDDRSIKQILALNDMIKDYMKKNNFVFKYFSGRPECIINFSYNWKAEQNSFEDIKKNIPALKDVDPSKFLPFTASAPDDTSNWLLLPDNKLLRIYHSVTTKDGKAASIFPPQDPNLSWYANAYKYLMFDTDGTLVKLP